MKYKESFGVRHGGGLWPSRPGKGLVAATELKAMKRYTGQKALYEAISRSQSKAKRGGILERLRPQTAKQDEPAREEPKPPAEQFETPAEGPPATEERPEPLAVKLRPVERVGRPAPPGPGQTWLRPKPVQLNAGRVEVSVPYHIAIAIALAVVVVVLVAFRLGRVGRNAQGSAQPVGSAVPADADRPARSTQENAATAGAGRTQLDTPLASPAVGERDHWIVLAQYKRRADLDQVVEYFAGHGIELGVMPLDEPSRKAFADLGFNAAILPSGNHYLLVTKNLYSNPQNPGTDGYEMKKRITDLGRGYKAPQGYESFAPNNFSDAYGMKIR